MSKNKVKILLLGLSNSGKTSIALSLQKTTNLLSYTSLKPTKGIEISEFEDNETEYFIWDFGGQERYRKSHIEKFSGVITQTSEIIYVIDVQDEDNYFLSIEFLREILKMLKEENYLINISIFLHKFDNDFKIDGEKIKDLTTKIKTNIPEGFNYKIFHTTIFTVFHKTESSFS